MSLTEIAGHKFTEGLMRDECARCGKRWASVIADRLRCGGGTPTEADQAQFEQERQWLAEAIFGTSSGSQPSAPSDGDACEATDSAEPPAPFHNVSANPYCFSFGGACSYCQAFGHKLYPDMTWGEIIDYLAYRP